MPASAVSTSDAIGGGVLNVVTVCYNTNPSPGSAAEFNELCRVSWICASSDAFTRAAIALEFSHDSFRGVALAVYRDGQRLGPEKVSIDYVFCPGH